MSDLLNLLWIDQDPLKIPNRGISNSGNTCYVASVIQCLVRFPGIRDYVNKVKADEPAADDLSLRACTFRIFSAYLNGSRSSAVDLTVQIQAQITALAEVTKTETAPFKWSEQHDSNEYYTRLVDKLIDNKNDSHAEFGNYIKEKTSVTMSKSSLCGSCGLREDLQSAVDYSLHVGISGDSFSIQESLLAQFHGTECIEAECAQCSKPTGKEKKLKAYTRSASYSEVLYLNLTWDGTNSNSLEATIPLDIEIESNKFQLFGVTYHHAYEKGGHYWAICKTKTGWKKFNDYSVSGEVPPPSSLHARGLFYRRL